MRNGYIYIIANQRPTLYTRVTNDLVRRVYEHKNHLVEGFSSKYNLDKLIYYEACKTIEEAIIREKQIKDMDRKDKLEMIKLLNPMLQDLYQTLL